MYSLLGYFLPNTSKSVSDEDSLPARDVPSPLTASQCSERGGQKTAASRAVNATLDQIWVAAAKFIGFAPLVQHNSEQKQQKKHPSSAKFRYVTSVCVCVCVYTPTV